MMKRPSSSSKSAAGNQQKELVGVLIIGVTLGLVTAQLGLSPFGLSPFNPSQFLNQDVCNCAIQDNKTPPPPSSDNVATDTSANHVVQESIPPTHDSQSTTTFITSKTSSSSSSSSSSEADIAKGIVLPFERTPIREYLPGKPTDTYTYFHHYMNQLGQASSTAPKDFSTLPLLHIWPRYFEAYNNHWSRYRGKENVVFMEIGVQSGGKIPMLRDYFGPGLTYIGIDINPSCKMFESADWIHIEIGDTGNREFLESIKQKHPKVDIFLDDGGHTMAQQRLAMEVLLPHLQPDGVFMCEDLSTSWSSTFGGVPWGTTANAAFRNKTTMGLVHRSLEWINSGWMPGEEMNFQLEHEGLNNYWQDTPWWREFVQSVKHCHIYNMLVVYEKGLVESPWHTTSVGFNIPLQYSGEHEKVQWEPVMETIQNYTKSEWSQ